MIVATKPTVVITDEKMCCYRSGRELKRNHMYSANWLHSKILLLTYNYKYVVENVTSLNIH